MSNYILRKLTEAERTVFNENFHQFRGVPGIKQIMYKDEKGEYTIPGGYTDMHSDRTNYNLDICPNSVLIRPEIFDGAKIKLRYTTAVDSTFGPDANVSLALPEYPPSDEKTDIIRYCHLSAVDSEFYDDVDIVAGGELKKARFFNTCRAKLIHINVTDSILVNVTINGLVLDPANEFGNNSSVTIIKSELSSVVLKDVIDIARVYSSVVFEESYLQDVEVTQVNHRNGEPLHNRMDCSPNYHISLQHAVVSNANINENTVIGTHYDFQANAFCSLYKDRAGNTMFGYIDPHARTFQKADKLEDIAIPHMEDSTIRYYYDTVNNNIHRNIAQGLMYSLDIDLLKLVNELKEGKITQFKKKNTVFNYRVEIEGGYNEVPKLKDGYNYYLKVSLYKDDELLEACVSEFSYCFSVSIISRTVEAIMKHCNYFKEPELLHYSDDIVPF